MGLLDRQPPPPPGRASGQVTAAMLDGSAVFRALRRVFTFLDGPRPVKDCPRLLTLPFSHFCEVARWGLDLAQIEYEEDARSPPFHIFSVHDVTKGQYSQTPVLVLPGSGGEVILESVEILKHLAATHEACAWLFPEKYASEGLAELLLWLVDEFGPASRATFYAHALKAEHEGDLKAVFANPKTQTRTVRWLMPVVFGNVVKALRRKNPASAVADMEAKVAQAFDKVDGLLADGRKYLLGDDPCAADIVFSALAMPVVGNDDLLADVAPDGSRFAEWEALCAPWRARPAGQFARRVYRELRPVDPATGKVRIRLAAKL